MIQLRQHEANFLREHKQKVIVKNHKYYLVERESALLLLEQYRNKIKV